MTLTLYTAYFSSPYETGMFFVGTFTTREAAEVALKETSNSLYYAPNILVHFLDVPVNKNDSDRSIALL
jgi:hypothetical protein